MEKEMAGVISIFAGVATILLCSLTLYIYPLLMLYKKVLIFLMLLGVVLGVYLIVLGWKFYKGKLPSMKRSSKMDGVFMILTGVLYMILPVLTYFSGYRNPWIMVFFLGGFYYMFIGREIYRGRIAMSMKGGLRFF